MNATPSTNPAIAVSPLAYAIPRHPKDPVTCFLLIRTPAQSNAPPWAPSKSLVPAATNNGLRLLPSLLTQPNRNVRARRHAPHCR